MVIKREFHTEIEGRELAEEKTQLALEREISNFWRKGLFLEKSSYRKDIACVKIFSL